MKQIARIKLAVMLGSSPDMDRGAMAMHNTFSIAGDSQQLESLLMAAITTGIIVYCEPAMLLKARDSFNHCGFRVTWTYGNE